MADIDTAARSSLGVKAHGILQREIKVRYFPERFRGSRTWKEIPQSKFADCMEWLRTFEWR